MIMASLDWAGSFARSHTPGEHSRPTPLKHPQQFADLMGTDPQPAPRPPRPEQDGTLEMARHRVLPISESDARDFPQYTAAKGKATALGVSLEIVPDNAFVQRVQPSGTAGEGVHIGEGGRRLWQIPRSLTRDINLTRDIKKYEAAKVRAAEQGLDLLIVPDDDSAA